MYCRRLSLQVPIAVSVKTGQIADVFHAVCRVAMNPCVFFYRSQRVVLRCRPARHVC